MSDLISRQAAYDLIRSLTRWCVRSEGGKFNNVGLLYDDVMFGIDRLSSVTPKQRTCDDVLNKIRAEIIDKYMTATGEVNTVAKGCLQIIDKYRVDEPVDESVDDPVVKPVDESEEQA